MTEARTEKVPTRLVVVFGMHRSGTSALTHALEPLGVSLGDHLLGPSPEVNAKGFFEDIDIFLHNEEILKTHGGAWYDVDDLSIPLEPGQLDADLLERATALLTDRLGRFGHFGVKDPRLCVTWPYWRAAVCSLGVEVRAIHAIRRPDDVAESLARRDGFPVHHGLLLWARYNEGALRYMSDYRNIVVDYDELVDSPLEVLTSLSDFLELPLDPDSPAIKAYVDDFVDGSLRRSSVRQARVERSPNEALLASVTTAVYEAMTHPPRDEDGEALGNGSVVTNLLSEALSFDGHYRLLLSQSLRELVELRSALESERTQAAQRIWAIEEDARVLREELAALRERTTEEMVHRERRITELDDELRAMHASLSWRITAPLRAVGRMLPRRRQHQ